MAPARTAPWTPPRPMPNYYSKHGAGILADAVMMYWVRQGWGNVVAERYAMGSTGNWGVRSNLVNGLPPARVRKGRAAAEREFLR